MPPDVPRAALPSWLAAVGVLSLVVIAAVCPLGGVPDEVRFWTILICMAAYGCVVFVLWSASETAARYSFVHNDARDDVADQAQRDIVWAGQLAAGCLWLALLAFATIGGDFMAPVGVAFVCAAAGLFVVRYAWMIWSVGEGSPNGVPSIWPAEPPKAIVPLLGVVWCSCLAVVAVASIQHSFGLATLIVVCTGINVSTFARGLWPRLPAVAWFSRVDKASTVVMLLALMWVFYNIVHGTAQIVAAWIGCGVGLVVTVVLVRSALSKRKAALG